MTRPRFARAGMCLVCIVVGLHWMTEAQSCPPIAVEQPADTVTILVKTANNSCTVTDGGYIKTGVSYKLHAIAHSEGKCQTRTLSQGQCVNLGSPYNRTLYGTLTYMNGAPQGPIVNSGPVWDYDSTVPYQCSGGKLWSTTTLGTHLYTSYTNTTPTACNFPNAGPADNQPVTMHALQCKPNFAVDPALDQIVRLAPPVAPNKVQVFLDPVTLAGAATALDTAINDWNARIASTGVQFEKVSSSCGSGPACITVLPVQQTPCGFSFRNWDGNGVITGDAELRLRTDWDTYSTDGLKRTFVHELGHFLGMENSDPACSVSQAIMHEGFNCAVSGNAYAVTINDYLPVTNTSYGGKTKLACGF